MEGAYCDGFWPTALSCLAELTVVVMPGTHLQPFPLGTQGAHSSLHYPVVLERTVRPCPAAEVLFEWIQASGEMGACCYSSYCPLLQRCLAMDFKATFLIESAL